MSSPTVNQNSSGGAAAEASRIADLSTDDLLSEFGINVEEGDDASTSDDDTGSTDDTTETETTTDEADTSEDGETASDDAGEDSEGEAGDEKPAEGRKPITEYEILTDEGEPAEINPDRKFRLKIDGKVRELTEDKVVRMAQSGGYNEKLQGEVEELRGKQGEFEQVRQYAQDLLLEIEDQKALNLRLLQDEDFLQDTRERLAAQLTPEARAAKAEATVRQIQADQAAAQVSKAGETFFKGDVLPRLEKIRQDFSTITEDELLGRFHKTVGPFLRNGVVPQQKWAEVVRLLDSDVSQWAVQLHESRAAATKAVEANSKAKITKAQEEATKLKRQVGKALKPGSGSAGAKGGKPAPKAIRNMDDAVDDIFRSVLPDDE